MIIFSVVRDLGEALGEYAHELLESSKLLNDFGQNLKNDPTPTDEERRQREFENMKDAFNYHGAICSAITKFDVPIDEPAPRQLRIVQRR